MNDLSRPALAHHAQHPAGWGRAGLYLALGLLTQTARADEAAPDVTPYRPSVSTPAALSAPGWMEIEAGGQRSHGQDPTRRDSLPYSVKLAFSPDWGIRIGGDAWVRQRNADGTATQGGGDTSVVLKRRFAIDDASAFGLEVGTKRPTATTGLGSGHADTGLNAIYSSDFDESWHTDLNLSATRLGGVDAGLGRRQTGWAAAVSRNLNPQWGVVGEFSGTVQSGAPSTSQGLFAGSVSLMRGVTLDLGASKGLTAASGGWSVFSGVTFLAGKLF